MSSSPEEVRKHVRSYLIVFGALMVFTVITVAVASLHLAVAMAVTVALVIATIKGSMVAGVFMHLSDERPVIYWSLVLTLVFFVVLMALPVLTTMDKLRLQ